MKIVQALTAGTALFGFQAVAVQAQIGAGTPPTTEPAPADESAEIIVTAAGRSQIAQDVPIALSVVGGEMIANAGITDVRGLRQLTPSLQSTTGQSSSSATVLRIRGVGTAGDNPGFEPAVGIFIDGVFRARAGLAIADLPPIARVEVLRGPQGTLFGRNTSAGALSIITQRPAFDLGGYAEAAYGNYNELELRAGLTGPVSEKVALRIDGGYHKRDGYIKDANADRSINDLDRYSVRGQAMFQSDTVKFRLIADYAHTNEQCCGALNTRQGSTGPAVEFLSGLAGRDGLVNPVDLKARRQAISPGRDYADGIKEYGISGQLDWELGDLNLTSITAYRNFRTLRNQDVDFSGLDRAYRQGYRNSLKDFTQEIRLNGKAFNDHLDWLVGGFYLNETNRLTDNIRLGTQADQYVDALLSASTTTLSPLAPNGFSLFGTLPGRPFLGNAFLASPSVQAIVGANPAVLPQFTTFLPSYVGGGQFNDNWRVKTNALAFFTHNIINFSDALSLTLGLRYNHETKKLAADLTVVSPACSAIEAGGSRSTFGAVFASNTGLNQIRLLVCNPVVNPEFNGIYSNKRSESEFTGTAKLAFKLSNRVLIYGGYDRGYKAGGYNLDRGGFVSRYFGGPGARISDIDFGPETVDAYEVGLKTDFSRQFTLNATAFSEIFHNFQDLTFIGTNFRVTEVRKAISRGVELESVIRPARDIDVNLGYAYIQTEYRDATLPPELIYGNGRQVTNQPKSTVTAALTWTPQLSGEVGALVHVDARLNSDANTVNDAAAIPFTTNDGYSIVNARIGLNFLENKLSVEAYVENMFNTYYNVTAFPVPEQSGAYAVYPGTPRFYGVKARVSF